MYGTYGAYGTYEAYGTYWSMSMNISIDGLVGIQITRHTDTRTYSTGRRVSRSTGIWAYGHMSI